MTPSGLSCHLAALTQCQESDSYYHGVVVAVESTAHTSLKPVRKHLPKSRVSQVIIF